MNSHLPSVNWKVISVICNLLFVIRYQISYTKASYLHLIYLKYYGIVNKMLKIKQFFFFKYRNQQNWSLNRKLYHFKENWYRKNIYIFVRLSNSLKQNRKENCDPLPTTYASVLNCSASCSHQIKQRNYSINWIKMDKSK